MPTHPAIRAALRAWPRRREPAARSPTGARTATGSRPDPATPCDAQVGIDPNRNYGQLWGGPGASSQPNSQTYRGTGPWSEPETQAVHEFSQVHDVTSLLTMHNFASLVLRPPGLHTQGQAPDEARLKELGDAMADDTGYTSQYGWQLYDTSGTTEDWNYGAAGTFGYTIELGPADVQGGNFHISYDKGVVDQWNGTGSRAGRGVRKALLRIAEWAASRPDFSTVYGRAPAGRILRLKKTFKTSSSPVCQFATVTDVNPATPEGVPTQDCINPGDPILVDDKLDYTTKVPANGVFSWIVTPSTEPVRLPGGQAHELHADVRGRFRARLPDQDRDDLARRGAEVRAAVWRDAASARTDAGRSPGAALLVQPQALPPDAQRDQLHRQVDRLGAEGADPARRQGHGVAVAAAGPEGQPGLPLHHGSGDPRPEDELSPRQVRAGPVDALRADRHLEVQARPEAAGRSLHRPGARHRRCGQH